MKDFNNKVVVITGAGSGMGRAYAQAFGKLGARLALNDFNAASLQETVELLQADGGNKLCCQAFDVADAEAFAGFAATVKAQLGNAHVIINNAGIEGAVKPVWEMTAADCERLMAVNFYGVVNGTRAFLPQLFANGEGAVVNVSSVFGLIGTPNNGDYCASKFAVRGYTEALMVELQDSPVNAFLVHPGGIATNIAQRPESQAFNEQLLTTPPEAVAEYVIRAVRRRQPRIVYGNQAAIVRLVSGLLPLKLRNAVLWRKLRAVTDTSLYPFLNKNTE